MTKRGLAGALAAAALAATSCGPAPADLKLALSISRTANVVSEDSPQCEVESYNQLACCEHVTRVTPETPEEVVTLVRDAMKQHRRIHAVGRAHTGNDAICPKAGGVALSTAKLNGTIALEPYHGFMSVVVDAGVTMIELTDWLDQHHYSLGFSVLEFRDATVGGVIGTGAHGSALDASAVVAEDVESIWVVTPRDLAADPGMTLPKEYVKNGSDEWKAWMTNLGLLGVVTRLRLRVEQQFNLKVNISYHNERELVADHGVTDLLAECDFGQLNWFPRADRVMETCGSVTHDFVPPGAANTLLTPRGKLSDLNTLKWFLHNMRHARGRTCFTESLRYFELWWNPPLAARKANGVSRITQAIGPSHQMMSSDLTKLEQDMPQVDLEIAVPIKRATEILDFVNRSVDRLHLCFPLVGIFLRFTPTAKHSLLAHSAMAGPGVMFIELVIFRPGDATFAARDDYFGPYLQLAEAVIAKYQGRAHWAKNNTALFKLQKAVNPDFAARVARFRAVADTLDPEHLFADDFSRDIGLTM